MKANSAAGFWKLAAAYCAGAAAMVPLYSRQIDADGISYISIAAKYLSGDFINAVNGYWGPLLSWLLLPFMAIGINPLVAAKIAGALAGLLALYGAYRLSLRYEMPEGVRYLVLGTLIPVLYSFFLVVISPDLLVAALLLLCFTLTLEPDFNASPRKQLACGALAAAAYYSKSYAMPFFLAYLVLAQLLRFMRAQGDGRTAVRRAFLRSAIVFGLLCAPWAGFLSAKYGSFTVNTTGAYNHAVVGPGYIGHPVNSEGFFAPPNLTAVSVWEDPSVIPVRKWSPLSSAKLFGRQLSLLLKNAFAVFDAYQSVTFFSFAILLCMILFLCGGWGEKWLLPLAALAIYSAGYMPIVVRARYLYFCYLVLYVMGAAVLGALFSNEFFTPLRRKLLVAAFAVSMLVSPLANLIGNFGQGAEMPALAGRLARAADFRGANIASNTMWMENLYLSYYLGARYFGEERKGASAQETEKVLRGMGIRYFLLWDDGARPMPGWREIPVPGILNLRLLEAGTAPAPDRGRQR